MRTTVKIAVIAAGAVVVLGGAAGVAAATGMVDADTPLTGDELSRAVEAATSEVAGEVVETEAGDDGAAYSVEIRRPDGSVVEVELDADFTVTGTELDDDSSEDDGRDDD